MRIDRRFGTWGLTPNAQGQPIYQVTPPKAPTRQRRVIARRRQPCRLRERKSLSGDVSRAVVVVGLGPAGADLLLPAARGARARAGAVRAHRASSRQSPTSPPKASRSSRSTSLYDSADDLDAVYAAIADRVVETAREHGEIVYAVPGSPTVAERSVELLRAAGARHRADSRHLVRRPRVVATRHRSDARCARRRRARVRDRRGRSSAARCCSRSATRSSCCSDVKLALLDTLGPDHEVTVLQRLGLPDEHVFTVALADLDREVEPDHLTSVFVDTGDVRGRGRAGATRSRSPNGCAVRAVARGTRSRRTTRCAATCSKRRTRWRRRSSSSRPTRRPATCRRHVRRARRRARRPALPGDDPFGARGRGRRVHHRRRRARACTTSSCAGTRTCSATSRSTTPSDVVTNWEQIKKAEKGDESLVAGVDGGLAGADRRAEALAQGRVESASIRGRRPATRALEAADRPTSRRRSARCSRPPPRSGASTTSTPSRRWRAGRGVTRIASVAWNNSRPTRESTSPPRQPNVVRELWDARGRRRCRFPVGGLPWLSRSSSSSSSSC